MEVCEQVTSFREAYWSGDPTGLEDAHTELERLKIQAELCIVDPNDADRDWVEATEVSTADYQRRLEFVRISYSERLFPSEWRVIKRCFENRCAYCGAHVQLYRDHVIPIMGGGRDYWKNVVPACRRCNSSKSDKALDGWLSTKENADAIRSRYATGVALRDSELEAMQR